MTAPACHRPTVAGALLRRVLWRCVFTVTGGLGVTGSRPPRGCVVVANHGSHADAPAILAALPARSRVVVVAAADYWFDRPWHARLARRLVSAFGIPRGSGGYRQLATAVPLLRAGGTVVVFPEGTRSRTGELGEFRSGAARLAADAGVPLVPVTVAGTREMLSAHGTFHRRPLAVHVGTPVTALAEARAEIAGRLARPVDRADSATRRRVAGLACSVLGPVVVACWAVAEAVSWPLLPELLLGVLVVAAPRRGVALTLTAAAASVLGGLLAWQLAAGGVTVPQPLTTDAMRATAAAQVGEEGAAAMRHQPLSGVPYKVYAAEAGGHGVDPLPFAAWSAATRGVRIVVVGLGLTLLAAALRRAARYYPAYLVALLGGFAGGLARVVLSWR